MLEVRVINKKELGNIGEEISTNYLADNSNIDADTLEDMYYTYLSDSDETIFNCEYSRINDMILGGE